MVLTKNKKSLLTEKTIFDNNTDDAYVNEILTKVNMWNPSLVKD